MSPSVRGTVRLLIKSVALALAFLGAFLVRFDGMVPPERRTQLLVMLPVVVVVKVVALYLAGVGRQSWQYTTLHDVLEITRVLAIVALLMLAGRLVFGGGAEPPLGIVGLPIGVIVADFLLSVGALVGLRVVRRLQSESHEASRARANGNGELRRVLLIGAGRAGVLTAREMKRRPDVGLEPVAFLDDDPKKLGRRVAGLDVAGTVDDVARIAHSHRVEQAVITIAALKRQAIQRIVDRCAEAGVATKIVPGLYEIVGGDVRVTRIRDVDVADLLGRDQVELDDAVTGALVTGRRVMVTGAGGSIGSELVRQVARLDPAGIVLVDQSEPALWAIDRDVAAQHPDLPLAPAIADVRDRPRMHRLFARYSPDVVIHAAAHKHVPMMEDNPGEAVKNNVGGTKVVADLAAAHEVERFVLVSTDKAVNPTSVMGATKRLAERYVQHVAEDTGLRAVAVRFGNVLGSVGSVVPIFKEQVARGGPVTVTHPDVRRYFMTIPEASQLVLQAAAIGRPGEILVLDMGEPVRIVDLARAVIRLSGFEPEVDIPITFTGLRPGEKLFEELSLSSEGATRTRHAKIWIGATDDRSWPSAEADLRRLLAAGDGAGAEEIRRLLRAMVPEYSGSSGDIDSAEPADGSAASSPAHAGAGGG